ncbi:dimethylarginine dimethylaminohydrolase family protein [Nafulsella turpanensis]|uniref:dimethylarginine dimethylaminohydrolase family protein n=1 Tax=Nafulsella turpanensis TaxID=1265690 RepID=UPI0003467BCD|nr:arginine deiminase family protein [Nafulsella turpanensis]
MERIKLQVSNETAPLKAVVLGIGKDMGEPRTIDPMSRKHLKNNTYPEEEDVREEIGAFEKVLRENGVEVYRPQNLEGVEQIFTRDIGFVIEDNFFVANMKEPVRQKELEGISGIMEQLDPSKIIEIPEGATIEGGDIVLWNKFVFVGQSGRTNSEGITFLQKMLPDKEVIPLRIRESKDPVEHILHLDCAFQPIGEEEAIIFPEGFVDPPEAILDIFSDKQLIKVNQEQKVRMCPNIFSISPEKIVVEEGFKSLKPLLRSRGYELFEIPYSETSKLSGLLRCSTLPLRREG